MNNYDTYREERLEYQKEYHAIFHDKYLDYQRWYYQNVLKNNRKSSKEKTRVQKQVVQKDKPTLKKDTTLLSKKFLMKLEKLYWKKSIDYNDTINAVETAKVLSSAPKPFQGFTVVNGMYRLTFD